MKTPDELRELEPGWDSYGALRISEEAIATAKAIEYVPSAHGGLDIVLNAGGVEVEIEVDAQGRVTSILWAPADG